MTSISTSTAPVLGSHLATCEHCSLTFSTKGAERFCCHGCATVFEMLSANGLERFYQLKSESPPSCPIPAQVSQDSFSFCDDPAVIARFTKSENEIEFFVEGLNCAACLWLLEKLPEICSDVLNITVNFAQSTVRIVRTPGGSFARAAQALNRIGYRPHLIDHSHSETAVLRKRERRMELVRIGIAAACTGNIMIFSVSLYGGAGDLLGHQFEWLTALLALPVLTYCAYPFYRSAWASLRARSLNLDVPIVVALIAGIAMSVWGLASQTGTLYFDSLSMLVFLLLSSRAWLKNIQQHYLDASHLEETILLRTIERILPGGACESVSTLSLKTGDRVSIHAGDLIPADGFVHSGEALIHSGVLTGESEPVSVRKSGRVFAGTQSLSGDWFLEVEKPAMDSRLAAILREAERSSASKPHLIRFSDRVGQAFIFVVFALALGTVLHFAQTDLSIGVSRALALVIVTCPCVFGMAIPLSVSLAIKAAAGRGIIIKNGDVVERLGKVKTVFMDKTGTLTNGDLVLQDIDLIDCDESDLAALVALERGQEHPVARAITKAMSSVLFEERNVAELKTLERGGIQGLIDGTAYSVIPLGTVDDSQNQNVLSSYGFFKGEKLLATFRMEDSVRTDAPEVLRHLQGRNLEVQILSGDRQSVVDLVGKQLGLSPELARGEATPEEKHHLLKASGKNAAMVGDGANDAAALGAASVGIAVRGSMDLSLKAADVYLLRPELSSIDSLFEIADRTRGAIARNLCFSAGFNLVAGALAVTGHMHPLWAAVLMPVSSFTVLISALATGRALEARRDSK